MATYFFDSSAVVKRYVAETGTAWITALLQPAASHQAYLASITAVEVVAAFGRRERGGQLSALDRDTALEQFRHDLNTAYRITGVTASLVVQAMYLAESHALRGYDAVQLAAALELHVERRNAGLPALTFVCADAELNAAAGIEGLIVEDPNAHP